MIEDPIKKEFPHKIIRRFKNRYGDEYWFERSGDNEYTIKGDLVHWRLGGREEVEGIDYDDLGFVDPSGGPFLALGMAIEGRKIIRISSEPDGIFFKVE